MAQFFVLLCSESVNPGGLQVKIPEDPDNLGDTDDSGKQISADPIDPIDPIDPLDACIELTVSDDGMTAFANLKKADPDVVTVEAIKKALGSLGVQFGIKKDSLIKTWLTLATPGGDAFAIAQGKSPVLSVDAIVDYHF